MKSKKIAVLGAGHGGYGMAADLTLAGYEVHFYGSKERGNLEPVIKQSGVELTGIARQGFAAIHCITNDIAEALEEYVKKDWLVTVEVKYCVEISVEAKRTEEEAKKEAMAELEGHTGRYISVDHPDDVEITDIEST